MIKTLDIDQLVDAAARGEPHSWDAEAVTCFDPGAAMSATTMTTAPMNARPLAHASTGDQQK